MTISAGVSYLCRLMIATFILCAAFAASANAGWETIGTSSYSGSTLGDGYRFIAFQPDDRHVAVLDTTFGNGVTTYLIPEKCAPDGYAFARSIGGGQALVECRSPNGDVRPVLLTLIAGAWTEPRLPSSPSVQTTADGFGAVGANWLERLNGGGAPAEWVNWHTNEIQPVSPEEGRVPDPNRATLYMEPCRGVHPASSPWVYEAPLAVVQTSGGGLRLQRCETARSFPIDPSAETTRVLRLADGIVTWVTSSPNTDAGAYLVDCRVRLRWRQPSGGTLVHAGRTLVQTLGPDKYGNPASVVRLLLPRGCPRSPAARPLRVGQLGRRRTVVRPDVARWRTSDAWGVAEARIEPGAFGPGRVVLRPDATLAVDAAAASVVRWSADGVAWKRARRKDGRWTVRLGHDMPHRLRLALRFRDGGTAEYRLRVRARDG